MRYFKAPSALFDALRLQVMDLMGMPSDFALEPWEQGRTSLALAEREHTPPQYSALVEYALENGATETASDEYQSLNINPNRK